MFSFSFLRNWKCDSRFFKTKIKIKKSIAIADFIKEKEKKKAILFFFLKPAFYNLKILTLLKIHKTPH